jgi:hypothetical protein
MSEKWDIHFVDKGKLLEVDGIIPALTPVPGGEAVR